MGLSTSIFHCSCSYQQCSSHHCSHQAFVSQGFLGRITWKKHNVAFKNFSVQLIHKSKIKQKWLYRCAVGISWNKRAIIQSDGSSDRYLSGALSKTERHTHRVMAFKSFDKSLADLSDSWPHWWWWLWLLHWDGRPAPSHIQLWGEQKQRGDSKPFAPVLLSTNAAQCW